MSITKKSLLIVIGITALILLIPLIAMQFTSEVDWGRMDFVIAAALLLSFGMLIAFALQRIKKKSLRYTVVAIILFILLVIWAELAVGVFGTPWAGD